MHINHTRRVSIELLDDEIDSMREICALAYLQLHSKPATQLSGSPLTRQSGLCGPELFRVKSMLEKFGRSLGVDLPYEPVTPAEPFPYPVAII